MKEIDIVIEEIRLLFKNDFSGHDYWHMMRVYKNALKISEQEKCDVRIISLAALLHDVDDKKLFTTNNYENAKMIMQKANIDGDVIKKVITIIEDISFKGIESIVPVTIEGKIVQDADRLDAMGAIGIARTFAYGGSKGQCMYDPNIPANLRMNADEYVGSQGTSINHFYEKLFHIKDLMNTGTAKKIAEKRDIFMHSYLETFLDEWKGI